MKRLIFAVVMFSVTTVWSGDLPLCTKEAPCSYGPASAAKHSREMVQRERSTEAKMADAPATEHNIEVTNRLMDLFREGIVLDRKYFSDFCASTLSLKEKLATLKGGPHLLTSEDLYKMVGQPEQDELLGESGRVRVWSWSSEGPFSGAIVFGLVFTRQQPDAPWVFFGCNWCVAGGTLMPRGCQTLPFTP